MKRRINSPLLAVLLIVGIPATVVGAPSIITGFASYISGRPTPDALTGNEIIGTVQNGRTTGLTLSSLVNYVSTAIGYQPVTDVTLSGAATVPQGSHTVNAEPGAQLVLPANASSGTTEYVSDYHGGAGNASISVSPSADAGIVGSTGAYTLTVPYQATGFRRTTNGWQPY